MRITVDAMPDLVIVTVLNTWTDDDGDEHEEHVELRLPPQAATDLGALLLDRARKVGEWPSS